MKGIKLGTDVNTPNFVKQINSCKKYRFIFRFEMKPSSNNRGNYVIM